MLGDKSLPALNSTNWDRFDLSVQPGTGQLELNALIISQLCLQTECSFVSSTIPILGGRCYCTPNSKIHNNFLQNMINYWKMCSLSLYVCSKNGKFWNWCVSDSQKLDYKWSKISLCQKSEQMFPCLCLLLKTLSRMSTVCALYESLEWNLMLLENCVRMKRNTADKRFTMFWLPGSVLR